MPKDLPCHKVCETCPWLKKNHRRPHPAGWYTVKNIRRLWNALRRGQTTGIICHASDPEQADYGGTAPIKPDAKPRACAGAILTVGKHITEINQCQLKADLAAYAARHEAPLTRIGIAAWFEATVFGQVPPVEDRREEVGLPWEGKPTRKGAAGQRSV